jgi:hypothetical protein
MYLLSETPDTLQEINIQMAADNRLTFNQRSALETISEIRRKILGMHL